MIEFNKPNETQKLIYDDKQNRQRTCIKTQIKLSPSIAQQ
jgi:hypothetical protein